MTENHGHSHCVYPCMALLSTQRMADHQIWFSFAHATDCDRSMLMLALIVVFRFPRTYGHCRERP